MCRSGAVSHSFNRWSGLTGFVAYLAIGRKSALSHRKEVRLEMESVIALEMLPAELEEEGLLECTFTCLFTCGYTYRTPVRI
jgi:hypothetical protein